MSTPGFTAEVSLYKTYAAYRAVNETAHAGGAVYPAQFSLFGARPHCLWHREVTFIIDPLTLEATPYYYWICT